VTLEEVKQAIRVDFDDDDDFITLLMNAAKEYIKDAIGVDYDASIPRHEVLLVALVEDAYRNRSYTVDGKSDKVRYIIKSIVQQLDWGRDD
jgi:uncharacterized phage protein (predicted DNA packaging)